MTDQAVPPRTFLSAVSPVDMAGEPGWRAARRRAAASWLSSRGFPSRKDEDWRYLDLKPLLSLPFTPPDEFPHDPSAVELESLGGPGLGGPRLVLVNGRFSPGLSSLTAGQWPGVRFGSVSREIRKGTSELQRCWTTPGAGFAHAFDALNAALTSDGAYLELAAGTAVDLPIEIVYLTVARDDLPLVSPRSVISARPGSVATIVETYVTMGQGHSLTNTHTRVVLAPGARIEHYRFQAEGSDAFHLSTVEVQAGAASHFASRTLGVGGLVARHEVRAALNHASAAVQLDGLYLPSGQQCHDNPVLVDHNAPGCTSSQLYKGIISGAGRGIFNGHVIVRPVAVGTTTHQTNKNLLLSDRAEVDTRPRLEIFADDVSVTHGAAVGQLDEEALFYLRSRGLPERAAQAMLVAGFAADVLERFQGGAIRQRAERLTAAHLQAALTDADRPGAAR